MGLPGVNVIIKGSSKGTVTDVDGNYKIDVPSEETVLEFSSVGFVKEEITVGNRVVIDMSLTPDVHALGEVVVVGYTSQRRQDLTGSIASVSDQDLEKMVFSTADKSLQGRVPGVQVRTDSNAPGGSVSVQIRGTSSLSASSQPLYVIDGFPISNDYINKPGTGWGSNPNPLNSIDPSNIESIQILKDASATAIYGSRANNGVVIITTKRGASGTAQVDYENSFSFSSPSKKYDFLNATELAQLENEAADLNNKPHIWTDQQIAAMGVGTDWQDVIFRRAVTQRHKITLSGGNDAVRYLVSGDLFETNKV